MKFVRFKNITRNQGSKYLVHHLIPSQGITVVWGKAKSGKTFWVLNMAMHVAAGISYRGRKTEAKAVFYCAFEGAFVFPDRVLAIGEHMGLSGRDVPFFLSDARITFNRVGGANDIIAAAINASEGAPVGMVILDTMARSFEGDENSSEDMKFYIKCAEDIVRDLQCAVIIIHHCGIEGSRPRGHTALTGACDAQLKVERASNIGSPIIQIKTKVEFMKDGPEDVEEYSILQPAIVDGVEVCYVEDAPKPFKSSGKPLVGAVSKALTILQKTMETTGDSRITLQEWRDIYTETVPGTKDTLRRTFDRARDRLLEDGIVKIVDGRYVELAKAP